MRDFQEDRLQQECYMWFYNHYKQFRGLLRYNLNNSANKVQGNKNKAMGLISGVSDMELNFEGVTTFIELKVAKGVQSKIQKDWEQLIKSHGFNYYIVRSVDEFKELITMLIEK